MGEGVGAGVEVGLAVRAGVGVAAVVGVAAGVGVAVGVEVAAGVGTDSGAGVGASIGVADGAGEGVGVGGGASEAHATPRSRTAAIATVSGRPMRPPRWRDEARVDALTRQTVPGSPEAPAARYGPPGCPERP